MKKQNEYWNKLFNHKFFDNKISKLFNEKKLLKSLFRSDKIIIYDIGANIGRTVREARSIFKKAKIYAFEPIKKNYEKVRIQKCNAFNFALGDKNENKFININLSRNLTSSSIYNFNKKSQSIKLNLHPKENFLNLSKNYTREKINIYRADYLIKNKKYNLQIPDFIKIDTQGYEYKILKGFGNFLKKVKVIKVEIMLDDLYKFDTEINHENILKILRKNNFIIYDICHIYKFLKKTQRTLWFEYVFVNKQFLKQIKSLK